MNVVMRDTELPLVYLQQGDLYCTGKHSVVTTVLGSCISVTMFYRRLGLSAISHGFLPRCRNQQSCGDGCRDRGRYVDCSIRIMVGWFKQYHVHSGELEVGIYGGAEMFGVGYRGRATASVGKQNIDTAEKLLGDGGLQVLTKDVGGTQGRKIYFNTRDGCIHVQYLQPTVVMADTVGACRGPLR